MGHEGSFGAGMGAARWIFWIVIILAVAALVKYLVST